MPDPQTTNDLIQRVAIIGLIISVLIYGINNIFNKPNASDKVAGTENLGDPKNYVECHEHGTHGAYVIDKFYCLVPLDRMKEMK